MLNFVAKVERVLAAVTALLLFTLNDVRMFQALPRAAEPGNGHVHAAWLRLFGQPQQVFLTAFDVGIRWGLASLVVALCVWALADTFRRVPVTE